MPSTRRRFLSGAAAGVALLAGCNDRASNGSRGTVTPVDVPMTDSELLAQAASIEYPSLVPAVVVTDEHFEAAIGHVESLLAALERELDEAGEVDFSDLHRPVPGRSDDGDHVVGQTSARVDSLREREPSLDALGDVQRALRDVSLYLGYVRAERGEITLEGIEGEIDSELETVGTRRSSIEYRVAEPLAATLPTLYVAESKLESARRLKYALEAATGGESEEPTTTRIAELRRQLARHRRRRRDAERFLAWATATDAPSRAGDFSRALRAVGDELDSLPDRFEPREEGGEPRTLAGEIRNNRRHVGYRANGWLGEFETYRETGRRVLGLLRGTRILVEVDAVDAAVQRTTDRLDGRTFPAESLPDEKRRAVARLQALVDGPAVQRWLGSRAESILGFAPRRGDDEGVTVEAVARTFFLYAVAAEWAGHSAERGRTLAASLEDRASTTSFQAQQS